MREIEASNRRMTELLNTLAQGEGTRPSILDGVALIRADRPLNRMPVLYEPSIVIVGQGRKRAYLGGAVYTYDPHNYLVLSVPLPVECDTEVDAHGPLLAVSIRVEVAILGELLMKMDRRPLPPDQDGAHGMSSTPLDLALSNATVRLLESLASPADAQVLGPQITREIVYRVLCGERGNSLRALVAINGRLSQIQRVLTRMHTNYSQAHEVTSLAEDAGMSVSAFHHNFKAITATSPLQYLKTVRLHKARMLMIHEGIGACIAADRVGYESKSQFNREFKRLFEATPIEEASRMREMLGLDSSRIARLECRDTEGSLIASRQSLKF
jgi:AraC-like DNA-binding protein